MNDAVARPGERRGAALTDGAREPGTALISAVPARLGRCVVRGGCGAGGDSKGQPCGRRRRRKHRRNEQRE